MPDSSFSPLRLYNAAMPLAAHGPAPPAEPASLDALALDLAAAETLRGPSSGDAVEPLTTQWFLHLEQVRHSRQGHWLRRLLEFGKHNGERLLGLGVGLGSDLVQYARSGAEVVAVCPSLEQLTLVRRNFDLRGLRGSFVHASPQAVPLESASIDVVCLTGLLHELADPTAVVEEVYRLLKPGGKLLAVVPAYYDVEYWSRWLLLKPAPPRANSLLNAVNRYKSRDLLKLFHRFHETRVSKRHLRRAEVPHLWRWLPLGLLERLAGRLLIFKGFKPVSAARVEQAVA